MMQMVQKKFTLCYEKKRCLYNSVPTSTNELNDLHHTISNGIMSTTARGIVLFITLTISDVKEVKAGKGGWRSWVQVRSFIT